jgi:hypothetical protein
MDLAHTSDLAAAPRLTLHRVRVLGVTVLAAIAALGFAWPGLMLARDLADPAMAGPGVPRHAVSLHRDLTPRFAAWAEERVRSGAAADAPLHDVPTTEWPMFSAVFYLMATQQLQEAAQRGELVHGDLSGHSPETDRAVEAARSLILDPVHHTWVRTHWGEDYLHDQNVFFRGLIIAGLTAHAELTGDESSLPMLRDQVETLAADLDASEHGVLDDYPGECYPIDVLATIAFIRRADRVLGTDHSAFALRSLRAFTGAHADEFGLPRFRVDLPSAAEVQPSRGVGTSWSLIFTPELWPEADRAWYRAYEEHFWQDHGWAAGFREYAPSTELEWTFEIDAGPVFDGFGTAASAFGIGAARAHGRFDHAYVLGAELAGSSWALPDGTLMLPRAISHAADAPYLGESAILYFLTVPPAEGMPIVTGGHVPGSVWFAFLVYFGVPLLVALIAWIELRRKDGPARLIQLVPGVPLIVLAVVLWWAGHPIASVLTACLGGLALLADAHRPAPLTV